MKSQTTTKTVQIIARIQFKADSRKVVYNVRSSDGTQVYQTFLFNGKACSCSCPATKPCYHMVQVEAHEAVREVQIAKAEMKKQEITSPAQAEDENEVVSVKVGDVTVCSSRKHIANAVEHTKWSQEMAAYARAKDAERARTRTATPDEVAAVEEVKAEAKMAAFQQGMDEQYAADPRAELAKQIEAEETAASNLRAFYNGL